MIKNLKRYRVEHHLTQLELSKLIGYDQTIISQWEHGSRDPNTDTLLKIAKVLNVTTDELVGNDNATQNAQRSESLTILQQSVIKKIAELPDSDVMRVSDFIQGITAKENEYFKLK